MKRIIKHLPQINNKKETIQKKAKDLFSNIKILLFLNKNNVKEFFQLIIKKYEPDFPKFIKYFYTNFFKRYPLNDLCWNYDLNYIFEENTFENFFLTNNICESTNRLLNMNYKGVCKSVKNFEEAIISLIKLYDEKNNYKEDNFTITWAIALYIRTEEIKSLIDYNIFKKIFQNYSKYLKEHNIIFEETNNADNILKEEKENNCNIDKESNYSSNYESSSSVESDEEITFNFSVFEDNNGDSGGDDEDDKLNENNNEINVKIKNDKSKKKQSKENKKVNKSRNKKKNKNNYNFKNKEGIIKIYCEDNIYFNFTSHYDENYDNSIIVIDKQNDNKNINEFYLYKHNRDNDYKEKYSYLNNRLKEDIINFKLDLRKKKLKSYINIIRFGLENLNICNY